MRGFTLIELLVALSIASIILGLSITSFADFQSGQELRQAAETLKTNLRLAQNQALSGVKNCSSGTLVGWYVAPQANAYTIASRCFTSSGTPRTVTLASGITLTTTNIGANSVLFRPINKDVALIDGGGSVSELTSDVGFTLTKGSQSITVWLRRTGDIFEGEV